MKILLVVGARPQFVKASSLSRELKNYKNIKEIIVHTGQHYDKKMSSIFFDELNITPPKYNLKVHEAKHGIMTSKMIQRLEKVFLKEKPEWVIVFGDTNSTLAGAIVANKLKIKLAHVESGMRSNNKRMPEEINRIITDRLSNLLFCPSKLSIRNLIKENHNKNDYKIINVGDIMFDNILYYKKFSKKPKIKINNNFILTTIHRAENVNNSKNLKNIFYSLNKISNDLQVILPVHPNTLKKVQKLKINTQSLTITSPVSYLEMIWLIQKCKFLITDSGGLQKEAFFLKTPCLIIREETEWVELVDDGINILVGTKKDSILKNYKKIIKRKSKFLVSNIYGKGDSSKKIITEIIKF